MESCVPPLGLRLERGVYFRPSKTPKMRAVGAITCQRRAGRGAGDCLEGAGFTGRAEVAHYREMPRPMAAGIRFQAVPALIATAGRAWMG